jgi:putative MATE family efflux protein
MKLKLLFPDAPKPGFYRHLLLLALPLMLQNIFTQALSFMDTLMVGRLGEYELAAVTCANTPFFIIALLLFGLQSGSSVLISQYWGKRDIAAINRILGVALYVAGGLTLLGGGLIFFFTDTVMGLVTSNQALIPLSSAYARIVAFSFFANSLSLMYIAAQRSMGNARFGMYILGVSMVVNTGLNWIFIFGKLGAPALGVEGAALATLFSRLIELSITAFFAFRLTSLPLIMKNLLRPGYKMARDFLRCAAPVVANEALWAVGFSLYPVIIGHMQDSVAAMAAFTIAGNLERLTSALYFGLGGASAVIIGNAVGAGESHADIYHKGSILNRLSPLIGLTAGACLLAITTGIIRPFLFPWFKLSVQAQEYCGAIMLILVLLSPLRAFTFTNLIGILRGGGDVKAALLIDISPMYLLALPLAAYMGLVLHWSVVWVYMAMVVDEACKTAVSFYRFRRKKWIHDMTKPA